MDNDILIISAAWFIGAFINGLTGMGGALIALPLISLFASSKDAIVVSMISGFLVGLMSLLLYWRYINIKEVLGFWLAALPGITSACGRSKSSTSRGWNFFSASCLSCTSPCSSFRTGSAPAWPPEPP